MAGEKDEKKKSSKSSSGEKTKAKKDKSTSDKKSSKSADVKSESKPKDKKSSDKLLDRKMELDKKLNGSAAARPAAPKRGPPPAKAPPSSGDYLADFDLPSSESESDGEVERRKVDESSRIVMAQVRLLFLPSGIRGFAKASRMFCFYAGQRKIDTIIRLIVCRRVQRSRGN
jgi:hypothetical protein